MVTEQFRVAGMSCDHCVQAVTAEVGRIAGVTAVAVELATGSMTVQSTQPIPPAQVAAAVDEAGYDLGR